MEQYNDKEGIEESMEIARLRFGMIAPVIQETYPDESIMAYCRRVSKIPMQLPDGRTVSYKPKTIGKWVSLYRNGGIDALAPKRRSDLGNTRVLTEDAIEEIYQIKKMFQHPKYPWMLADVDYFVELPDGTTAILEIKTTNYNAKDNWWLDGEETIPAYYECQGRH